MIGVDLFYLESSKSPNHFNSSSIQIKSFSLESIDQKNDLKQFRASNGFKNTVIKSNGISRNDSNPEIISVSGSVKRSDSSNFSGIC